MSLVRRWVHLPVPVPSGRGIAVGATVGALASLPLVRGIAMTYGASDAELEETLPGDELLPGAQVEATRATTIRARPADVWPWLAQIGYDRGGFYSFDRLERAVGLDIRSADHVEERWQDLAVGDLVHLAPELALRAVVVQPPRALVLRTPPEPGPFAFTWTFSLNPRPDGATRLVVRERYERRARYAPLVELVQAASAIMTAGMLRGIRERAEAHAPRSTAGEVPTPRRTHDGEAW